MIMSSQYAIDILYIICRQPVEILDNLSSAFGTLPMCFMRGKYYEHSLREPVREGFNGKRGVIKYSDLKGYNAANDTR